MQVQHIVSAANLKFPNLRISARKKIQVVQTLRPAHKLACFAQVTSYVQSKRQQKVERNLNRTVLDDIVHDKVRLALDVCFLVGLQI